MSDFIRNVVYWRLAIFKFLSGLVKVGLMTFLASTAAVNWVSLHAWERFFIIAAALVQMLTYTEGFIDQTATRLLAGKPPIGTGHTDIIKHPDA